jgi:hypothetical protein
MARTISAGVARWEFAAFLKSVAFTEASWIAGFATTAAPERVRTAEALVITDVTHATAHWAVRKYLVFDAFPVPRQLWSVHGAISMRVAEELFVPARRWGRCWATALEGVLG